MNIQRFYQVAGHIFAAGAVFWGVVGHIIRDTDPTLAGYAWMLAIALTLVSTRCWVMGRD